MTEIPGNTQAERKLRELLTRLYGTEVDADARLAQLEAEDVLGASDHAPQDGVERFATVWGRTLAGPGAGRMTANEWHTNLERLTRWIAQALTSYPFNPVLAGRVGTLLCQQTNGSAESLGHTIAVVEQRFLTELGYTVETYGERLHHVVGEIAVGYAHALHRDVLDEQGLLRRAAQIARDEAVQAIQTSEARFRHEATHDPLTGLPNRRYLTEHLSKVFSRPPGTEQRRLGICFIDLDGFKSINDGLGHYVGDLLLTEMARRLESRLTEHFVARLAGDEFVVVVEDTESVDDVIKVADATLATIAQPVHIEDNKLAITASIGLVERAISETSPAELIRAADITLNWAKRAGRGRWSVFDARRGDQDVARFALSAAMPAAVDREEFYLEYQPMVRLADNALIGVEALLRWNHPQLGVLPADQFVDLAEENGLLTRLSRWVLTEACHRATRWHEQTDDQLLMSVNLSQRQLSDPGLATTVAEVLEQTALPAGQLQLEIAETSVGNVDIPARRAVEALADMGVRIAIDEFGTGYFNLSELRALPVHMLKVHRSFVAGLLTADAVEQDILAALVSLARSLNAVPAAHGIETPEQADRLRELGYDIGQGWFFGHPMPDMTVGAIGR